jgi:murein DD-endopeptidase MepM/ murein hydrolase activator NlpD
MGYRLPFKQLGDLWGATQGRNQPHRGLDFPAAPGSKVRAVVNSKIVQAGFSEQLGFYVICLDAKGIFWGYNHLQTPIEALKLHVGKSVLRGTTIGLVGSTGSASTGPHLHLTASKDSHGNFVGITLNPLTILKGK